MLAKLVVVFFLLLGLILAEEYYCPEVTTKGEDRRTDKSKFRVVQFNAEWLFEDGADSCPGTTCPWKTQDDASAHLDAIASVISDLNPDFLNLCEVESCHELNDLINNAKLSGKGYKPYMVKGTDSATGQDVGMLTKIDPNQDLFRIEDKVYYPIPGTTCTSTYTGTQGVSKHYITTFTVNSTKIAIIAAHLLAFPDDQNRCIQREAQATVLQTIITSQIEAGYEVIVLGDFNDWDNSAIDANNNKPISQVGDILRGKGTKWSLTNIASKLIQNERYSEWYDENADCVYDLTENSMIDHILVSSGLINEVTNVFIAHNEFTQSCTGFYYSDHWPVVVDFQF